MPLSFSLKYILIILASIFFIFISISGVLFFILKHDYIYEYNLNFYPITERTSLEIEEIREINSQIKNYFFDETEFLEVSIFNEKEIYHMKDVKDIINNLFLYGKLSSVVFVIIALICVKKYKVRIYSVFKASSIVYSAMLLALAIGFLISFNKLFIIFHEIAFSNDLWKLNINEDYLLMMYPENFFRDIALLILIFSISINFFLFFAFKSLKK
ncbi:MAG: TIGR01906 family membrane protein [Dehalococcoidia bacterium]|nr:TIGR01906 family membrane protein [Dehalococcoidia bacterium]